MRRIARFLSAALWLGTFLGLCHAQENAGLPDEAVKEMEYYVGHWKGEYTLQDKPILLETDFAWTLDKRFLVGGFTGRDKATGAVVAKLHLVGGWCPVAGKYQEWVFDSNGGSSHTIWTAGPEGERRGEVSGMLDGKPIKYLNVRRIVDRDTMTGVIRDISAANANPPEVPYTMRRTSGPEIKLPAEFVAECDSYLGDWATEAEIDGKIYRGTWIVRWSPDKTCLITHWAADTPNGPGAGTRFEGWDSQAKKVLVIDFGSDGASSIERYSLTSNQVSEGEIAGVSPAGAPFRATARLVRNTPDFLAWTVTRDGHAIEYRFRRVAK